MGIEGIGLIRSAGVIDHGDNRFAGVVCRGAGMIASAEQALKNSSNGRPRVVDDILTTLPVSRIIHHGQEILSSACRDAINGDVGEKTARSIAGAVSEEITRGLVVTGTVLGVGGALASGGSALAVGCLGAAGYLLLPGLARRGAEALVVQLGGAAQNLGVVLRGRFGASESGNISN